MQLATLQLKSRQLIQLICLTAVAVSLVLGPLAQSASAITCQEVNVVPPYTSGHYDPNGVLYFVTTNPLTVPGPADSECSYINIKNIQNGWSPDGGVTYKCWSFRIHYTGGGPWTNEVGVCAGPTDVVGISPGPVANGSTYRPATVPNVNLRYTVRH